MSPLRFFVCAALAGACAAGSALAQAQPRPCSAVFTEETHGGDRLSQQGEVRFGPLMRLDDGSFMAHGSGETTVTYHADNCTVGGSPVTRTVHAMLVSDGQEAEIDITPVDADMPVQIRCPFAQLSEYTASVDGSPTIVVPMVDNASAQMSEGDRRRGAIWTLRLRMCAG